MRQVILAAVLAAVCGVACAEEDTNLYFRAFTISPAFGERAVTCDRLKKGTTNEMLRCFLSQLAGVTWPLGAESMVSLDDPDHLIVRNTRRNLTSISDMLDSEELGFDRYRSRVAIEFSSVAFKSADIEKLQKGEGVSLNSLAELQKQGRSRLITTARIVTRTGQEAVAKEVQEVSWPTAMEFGFSTNRAGDSSWALVPSKFEKREVGTILQVVSEISASGQWINLILNPQRVTLRRWETVEAAAGSNGESTKVPLRLPVFDCSTVQTMLMVKEGETVLLGGCEQSDQDWVQYHFVKAETVRPKSQK